MNIPRHKHRVFENQEYYQFPINNKYGIPEIEQTKTTGDKLIRFCDFNQVENKKDYIAHFFYDDYKFIQAWRNPDKYIDRLRAFKAVIAPDFSLYTDFPVALQILSCYRKNWCGAYWNLMGIDVIPCVTWGEESTFDFCFEGIPKNSTVAVSSVGVKRDNEWNGKKGDLFKRGFDEMMNRLEPSSVIFYGDLVDGIGGGGSTNIIKCASYYDEKREMLNELKVAKHGKRK